MLVALAITAANFDARATNWGRLLGEFTETGTVMKEGAHAAEDAARIARKEGGVAESVTREAGRLGEKTEGKLALRELLTEGMRAEKADAETLRSLTEIAEGDVDVAVVYMRGGRRLREAVPDLLTRARLTQQGGAPALAALGLRDSAVADDFLKLDALVTAGKLPAEVAGKPTLARLGELLSESSGRFEKFYERYVRGNEGEWAAGGALAWWLADPDSFQDAAGRFTEAGTRKLTELVGALGAATLTGVAEGSTEAARQVGNALVHGYFTGAYAWAAWVGLVLFVYLIGIALRLTRPLFLAPIFFLFRRHS